MFADEKLTDEDREFLAGALSTIADGGNADSALDVKVGKGERKSKHVRDTKIALEFIYGWIAQAIAPEEEDGLGMTLKKATDLLSCETLVLPSAQTIRRYWNERRNTQTRIFRVKTD